MALRRLQLQATTENLKILWKEIGFGPIPANQEIKVIFLVQEKLF